MRKQLWFWVLVAIAAGIVFGLVAPGPAKDSKWLADAFLQLIKTVTAPVIGSSARTAPYQSCITCSLLKKPP